MFQTLVNEIGVHDTVIYGLKVLSVIGAWCFIVWVFLLINKEGKK